VIQGIVEHSVLFQGVHIGKDSFIKDTVIMPDAEIGENVIIERAIVPSGMKIEDGTIIRSDEGTEEVILVSEEMLLSSQTLKMEN
jgi:glucose-1-phosphate adenylyltransferase